MQTQKQSLHSGMVEQQIEIDLSGQINLYGCMFRGNRLRYETQCTTRRCLLSLAIIIARLFFFPSSGMLRAWCGSAKRQRLFRFLFLLAIVFDVFSLLVGHRLHLLTGIQPHLLRSCNGINRPSKILSDLHLRIHPLDITREDKPVVSCESGSTMHFLLFFRYT
jgi:hypothetical protein